MPEAELSLVFLRPLNRLGLRYIVSGGVASILYGEPRFTNDVDLVVFLRHEDIRRLAEAFPAPTTTHLPLGRAGKCAASVLRGSAARTPASNKA